MTVVIDKNRRGDWQYVVQDTTGMIVQSGFRSYEDAEKYILKGGGQ